jgi:hypothetical protein
MEELFDEGPTFLDRLLRKIPGFGGYLDRAARRQSDEHARRLAAEHLDRAKRGLDECARALADSGQLDRIPLLDRLRHRLDRLIAQLRGAPAGASGFYQAQRLNEELVEDLYEYDLWTIDEAEKLAGQIESLARHDADPIQLTNELALSVGEFEHKVAERQKLLAEAASPD